MIKLKDALITDSLPDFLKEEPRVRALAYAINKQARYLILKQDAARVYSGIEICSERVLDVFAYELKIPQYKDTFSIDIKRRMVANGLIYWSTLGTVGALEQLCSDIFEDATVEEWFDYDGEPCHFKIVTENYKLTNADIAEFKSCVNAVKRLTAHMDDFIVKFPDVELNLLVGLPSSNIQDTALNGDERVTINYRDTMREYIFTSNSNVQDIALNGDEMVYINYSDTLVQRQAKPHADVQDIEINLNVKEALLE